MDGENNAKAPPAQAPRSRLLLSCGESILAVAGSAFRRVEASRGAAGCLARGASCAAGPVLRPLRRLRPTCLSALSFADRRLAAAQGKVDGFVLLVESMPSRFDGAADGLEALVAGLRGGGGVAAVLAPAGRARRDGKSGDGGNVFRDIRCDDEEAGGAARRDAEKVCEDVSAGARSLDAVTVAVDGGGGGNEDGRAGDEVKTISRVASEDEIAGETQSDEEMERSDTGSDHLKPRSDEAGHDDEAAHAEAEEQEAGSDEGEGEEGQMSLDAPGAEQRDEGVRVEQDGRSMDAVTVAADGGGDVGGGAGDEAKAISRAASADEIAGEAQCDEEMERSDTGSDHLRPSSDEIGHDDGAVQAGSDESKGGEDQTNFDAPGADEQHDEGVQDGSSMEANAAEAIEAVKVESQQVASPDAGSTSETGEASRKESSDDGDLLHLFDQAWQHKLA